MTFRRDIFNNKFSFEITRGTTRGTTRITGKKKKKRSKMLAGKNKMLAYKKKSAS